MDKVEAQSKGLFWTDFKDIPQGFRNLYSIILAVTPLADAVVRETDTFEMCCEYWFNNQVFDILERIKEAPTEIHRHSPENG